MLKQFITACFPVKSQKQWGCYLYSKKLVDWHVAVHTVCIQVQKLNATWSMFWKIMRHFHNRDKLRHGTLCVLLYTSSWSFFGNNWGKSNTILFVLQPHVRALTLLRYRGLNEWLQSRLPDVILPYFIFLWKKHSNPTFHFKYIRGSFPYKLTYLYTPTKLFTTELVKNQNAKLQRANKINTLKGKRSHTTLN